MPMIVSKYIRNENEKTIGIKLDLNCDTSRGIESARFPQCSLFVREGEEI